MGHLSLVVSGDTVTVTGNVLHLTPLSPSTMACPSTLPNSILHIHHTYSHPHSPHTCPSTCTHPGPPSVAHDVSVPDVRPFTAQLTWTAPEDDGGVSNPSWDPSLDSRENTTYLTYTVTLTNGTVTTMATTQALFLSLTFLQHSTPYSVTVEAENVYGRGPQGTASFNTPDSGEWRASDWRAHV